MTPRWKEREFLILPVLAALVVWGHQSGALDPGMIDKLLLALAAAVPGFQISRGLAKGKTPPAEPPAGGAA